MNLTILKLATIANSIIAAGGVASKVNLDTMMPLGLLVSAVVGTGMIVWRVATLANNLKVRLDEAERRIAELESNLKGKGHHCEP